MTRSKSYRDLVRQVGHKQKETWGAGPNVNGIGAKGDEKLPYVKEVESESSRFALTRQLLQIT